LKLPTGLENDARFLLLVSPHGLSVLFILGTATQKYSNPKGHTRPPGMLLLETVQFTQMYAHTPEFAFVFVLVVVTVAVAIALSVAVVVAAALTSLYHMDDLPYPCISVARFRSNTWTS